MDETVKAVWLAALRSGKYRRVEGSLRERMHGKTKYCCLGGLCDLGEKKNWVELGSSFGETLYKYGNYPTSDGSFPPKFILRKSGISKANSRLLASMNDDGATFKQIVRWIEECL